MRNSDRVIKLTEITTSESSPMADARFIETPVWVIAQNIAYFKAHTSTLPKGLTIKGAEIYFDELALGGVIVRERPEAIDDMIDGYFS